MWLVQYSPPRRGGVARQRRGGQFGNNVVCRSDHPVCAFALLGASSLEASPYRARASRPPLQGGEYPSSAAAQFIQDLFGLAHVQVFVELTVDLDHGRRGAGSQAFELDGRKQAVSRDFAQVYAEFAFHTPLDVI